MDERRRFAGLVPWPSMTSSACSSFLAGGVENSDQGRTQLRQAPRQGLRRAPSSCGRRRTAGPLKVSIVSVVDPVETGTSKEQKAPIVQVEALPALPLRPDGGQHPARNGSSSTAPRYSGSVSTTFRAGSRYRRRGSRQRRERLRVGRRRELYWSNQSSRSERRFPLHHGHGGHPDGAAMAPAPEPTITGVPDPRWSRATVPIPSPASPGLCASSSKRTGLRRARPMS